MKKQFYQAFNHDMLSDGEGYSSNNKYHMHLILSISDDTNSDSIRPALVKRGVLKPRFRWHITCFDDYLIELYKEGKTIDVMSQEMNRPEWIIVGRIWEMGERGKLKPEMWGCRAKGEVRKGPCDR